MDSFEKLMSTKEDLCEELQMYFSKQGNFPVIKHPLVFSVPHFEQMNALCNKQLKTKKEAVNEFLEKKDVVGAIFMYEKPYRVEAFRMYQHLLDDEQYFELLSDIWTNIENVWQIKKKIELFRPKGRDIGKRSFMMTNQEREFLNRLPEQITIYRGCCLNNKKGWSWTIEKSKAIWFSKRFCNNGFVLSAIVNKSDVIAYLNCRDENEIIVDPKKIKLNG